MDDEKVLRDKLKLIEKEFATLSEAFERADKSLREIDDLKQEVKALKVCLGKLDPKFKDEFLSAMTKVTKKG